MTESADHLRNQLEKRRHKFRTGAATPPCSSHGPGCVPASPWASPLSNPTQTSVTSVGVYPTNHASRPSFVVPVLPATVPGLLSPRTDEAVPASMTPVRSDVMT